MSMLSHLEALERRHEALDKEIEDVMKTHPSIDPLEIKALKRKKLQVKDEIARLKDDPTMH
ncbi:YdcH family protein [Mesorhizobium sp. BR1-1-16]|uniref:YdcH family protein n=1 Tax=Mesorhizobium sp. BR1-1-16 TaxID=2876653 RepID=UPI001CCC77FB|nr:YdcH family protein [Mesorhizobium sp. BR1-1-16]MBZ9939099.1 YdcH family protein [Mesorhizobium sp. BR1-1-16]